MLYVETYLAPSPIHGIGLFAATRVEQGTTIWEFVPGFDQELSEEDIARLSGACRERILNYAYYNARKLRHILCADDARFMNHSEDPNTVSLGFDAEGDGEGRTIAARDIMPHEEITEDYRSFDRSGRILR
jgi:SET domain-containing protein